MVLYRITARLGACQTATDDPMRKNKVGCTQTIDLETGETGEESDSPCSSIEHALLEEVEFWRSYIEYCSKTIGPPVPEEAYDALAQSERKLQSFMASNKTLRKDCLRVH